MSRSGMRVEERRLDSRGRLYLSRSLSGSRVYVARAGGVIVVARSREEAAEAAELLASRRSEGVIEEYLGLLEELGEPSVEEVEEAAREEQWRKLERLRGAPEASS